MMKNILALFLIFGLSLAAMAQQGRLSTTVPHRSAKKEKPWSLGLEYETKSDLQQEQDQRVSQHGLEIPFSYELPKDFSIAVSTGIEWAADGNNIRKDTDNPSWKDFLISGGWSTKLLSNTTLKLGLTEALPTGNESRLEGVKSTVVGLAALSSKFFNSKLTVTNRLQGVKLFQTYEYSVTTLESNPDMIGEYQLGVGYSFLSYWKIGVAASAMSIRFLDGENALRTSVKESLSFNKEGWTVSLAYNVGTYDKNDSYRLLYLDDTKRVISLGVGFEI